MRYYSNSSRSNKISIVIYLYTHSLGVRDFSGAASEFLIEKIFKDEQVKKGNFSKMIHGLVDVSESFASTLS